LVKLHLMPASQGPTKDNPIGRDRSGGSGAVLRPVGPWRGRLRLTAELPHRGSVKWRASRCPNTSCW
jgi:hypothetical protein